MTIMQMMKNQRSAMFSLVLGTVVLGGMSTTSFAACTTDAAAAQKAAAFIANRGSLLNGPSGPRSSDEITNDVRDFVAADPAALPVVIALLNSTPPNALSEDQQKAIGSGLGAASNICKTPDLNFATEIQNQLAGTDAGFAKTQYAAITGNNPIRAVAAGGLGSGSGGSVGGQTTPTNPATGSGSSVQAFAAEFSKNTATNYFNASVSGAGGAGGTTTTIVCTVSQAC